jgi:UDP-3-O-[3-hydroxymyristoyl] glucosamine N-acyltransferase
VKRVTLGELARVLEGVLEGEPDVLVSGVAPLHTAGPDQVSFLSNPRYAPSLKTTRAGGVIVSEDVCEGGLNLIHVTDPYLGFAAAMEFFYGRPYDGTGVSEKASVHPDAEVGELSSIHPFAVVCEGARIGDRVTLMPGVYVGPGASVGDDSVLHPNVVLEWGVSVGRRVIIHAGTVIGSDGFGFARDGKTHRKIVHSGIVRIEDDVEIGAACAIDRAVMGETVIGSGSKLDNLIMVAHNVRIGKNCLLAGQTGIAGSTKLGDEVTMAGQSGVAGHLQVGDNVVILAKAGVLRDLPDGARVAGYPAVDSREWRRNAAVWGKLDELRKRVIRLEGFWKRNRNFREEDRD